jgi:hypothetical protein
MGNNWTFFPTWHRECLLYYLTIILFGKIHKALVEQRAEPLGGQTESHAIYWNWENHTVL